ncbi:MAG: hypothetical protein WBM00_12935 [Solirubrobacterales bacterium]
MKKIAVLGTLIGLLAFVVSAQAKPHYAPSPPPGSHHCQPHNVGYYATGTLVNATLTPEGKNRYSGTIEVNVTKANHHAATGDQTFTLTGARVNFHHGVDSTAPAQGSRVKLHGKITALAKKCPTEGFTPTITVKKVDIRQAKPH